MLKEIMNFNRLLWWLRRPAMAIMPWPMPWAWHHRLVVVLVFGDLDLTNNEKCHFRAVQPVLGKRIHVL